MAQILCALTRLFRSKPQSIGFFATREQATGYARRELGHLGKRIAVVNHLDGFAVYRIGGL
ncbi:hypothetical protein [Craterilacuibacter sinensis]|uniref:Uncharacterized protein n=1 Tax=Craterilacuibacter sinensis TaxID=2686017 RepID=A0A845BV61_9NEIS|nr:hypothetical protein [Craterilacuibacter sinensis]MXR38036.1 hypothetical protein [Craterilacuibacter sinensis]